MLFTRFAMSSVDSSDHTSSSFRSVVSAAPPPPPWTLLLLLPLPLIHYWLPVPVVPTRTTTIGGSLGLDCRTTALLRPSSDRFGDLRSLSAQGRRYCGRIERPVLVSSPMTHVPHWRIHILTVVALRNHHGLFIAWICRTYGHCHMKML